MNIFIIEDEDMAARRLQKLISDCEPGAVISGRADGIESAVAWLKNHPQPDLIFMDIHLSDGSAFEIFSRFQVQSPIIFSTAYDQYAIQAFKHHTIDYLLKPVKVEELRQALAKYQRMTAAQTPDYQSLADLIPQVRAPRRFLIRSGSTMKVVDASEAAYYFSQNKITYLVATNGKRYAIDFTMDKLEQLLDPTTFFRINRQFIISVAAIREMHAHSKSRVKIVLSPSSEEEVVVSAERSPHFKRWLTNTDEDDFQADA
ncbi:MAG: response regulator transcription factor [Saprospiraceae bacterium]|jgi:two-component system LytT family response regulator|nr:response regulator transcription factor [Saprospiraceae bacterium]HRD82296.1 LytTR family DNA-binding domain-containing protein [Saprospiraceae bacterium]